MTTQFAVIPESVLLDTTISAHAIRLVQLLGIHAQGDVWCWPKLATLGAKIGIKKSAAHYHMSQLVRAGYVERKQMTLPKTGVVVTAYHILYERKLPQRSIPSNGKEWRRSISSDRGVRSHRTMEVTTTESNKGARGDLALGPSPAPTWLGNRVIVATNRYEDS